jgi:hypothetical protein
LSKFRIYRADTADPKDVSRRNKKFYMAYVFLGLLVMLTANIHYNSDRSVDFGQKISVHDTLKTLKNINHLTIDFCTNKV